MQMSQTLSVRALAREIAPGGGPVAAGRRPIPVRLAPLASIGVGIVLVVLLAGHGQEFLHALGRALHASWLLVAIGALCEVVSIAGYVLLLHRVVSSASTRLRPKDSYDIALAGTAATRLLPTAGLGGAAVTVWALRARGVRPREVTERLLAFLVLLYSVYVIALALAGGAVATGLVPVPHGRELGAVGALLAVALGGAVMAVLAVPSFARGLLSAAARISPRAAAAAQRAEEQLPVLRAALRRSWLELRRPHAALLGAVAWWAFDIGVLVAMLHAFGAGPPVVAVVLAYFLGTMFNVLPLPGSLSGGLIGVLVALGVAATPAIAAVLAYRCVAVWLPAASGLASAASLRASVAGWRAEATAG